MTRAGGMRVAAAALITAAYAALALASVRLDRLEAGAERASRAAATAARVRAAQQRIPELQRVLYGGLGPQHDAFEREMEREIGLLEAEADRRLAAPVAEAAAPDPDAELKALYREELLVAVRAGVLEAVPARCLRLAAVAGLDTPAQRSAGNAAVVRVSDQLAERCSRRLAEALDRPAAPAFAPLDDWADGALRAELASVLTPEQRARLAGQPIFGGAGGEK